MPYYLHASHQGRAVNGRLIQRSASWKENLAVVPNLGAVTMSISKNQPPAAATMA
ncbi:hypothetical protein SCLCIDRAFT_1206823 [Scleroderma citrinum Foug A]|uniref:Uncharacterized protein n=1 Tax=Scleroderma citrinum Foug A TaxID=1036808 RepID=A0A0C3EDF2_9AGAM|nr:hypothetical protein SCLCIDRAFT_1206823 [Scleroderma citrinum Foug A]